MMKKGIFILFLIILIIGIGIFFVWKWEVNNKQNILDGMANISISAIFEGNKVITGFEIQTINELINGQTSSSYERLIVNINQTIKVTNVNLENQSYYINTEDYYIKSNENRIDIILLKPEEVTIDIEKFDKYLIIELYSKNLMNPKFCLIWSMNYYLVKANNFTEIKKLDNYKNWDRCYESNFSLKNSVEKINISYNMFGILNEKDYINISIIDPQFIGIRDKIVKIV